MKAFLSALHWSSMLPPSAERILYELFMFFFSSNRDTLASSLPTPATHLSGGFVLVNRGVYRIHPSVPSYNVCSSISRQSCSSVSFGELIRVKNFSVIFERFRVVYRYFFFAFFAYFAVCEEIFFGFAVVSRSSVDSWVLCACATLCSLTSEFVAGLDSWIKGNGWVMVSVLEEEICGDFGPMKCVLWRRFMTFFFPLWSRRSQTVKITSSLANHNQWLTYCVLCV